MAVYKTLFKNSLVEREIAKTSFALKVKKSIAKKF